MSRIHEALTRTGGGAREQAPGEKSGDLFEPAWSVRNEPGPRALPGGGATAEPERPQALGPVGGEPTGLIRFSSEWRERLAGGPQGDVGLTEQFRRLAATLHHAHQNNGLKDVMVTSASPGDGKTLTAVNLAMVLAESYHYNVLLIDADLRRPSIPNVMGLSQGSGLSEVLRAPTEQKLALAAITPRLTLLPAGQPTPNSVEALTSPRMRQILDEAAARFDWVILDAPPVGPTTDARLLANMVGGTLFVIHAGQSQCPDVQKAVDAIGREQILGVVLNGVQDAGPAPYYYGARP